TTACSQRSTRTGTGAGQASTLQPAPGVRRAGPEDAVVLRLRLAAAVAVAGQDVEAAVRPRDRVAQAPETAEQRLLRRQAPGVAGVDGESHQVAGLQRGDQEGLLLVGVRGVEGHARGRPGVVAALGERLLPG